MFGVFQDRLRSGQPTARYRELTDNDQEYDKTCSDLEDRSSVIPSWSLPDLQRIAWWLIGLLAGLAVFVIFWFSWPNSGNFLPKLRSTLVEFEPNHLFMSAPSSESDAAWDNLIPRGRGFVLVDNPEAYGLGRGIPTDAGPDRYSVSMFHQLHCLAVIRNGYYSVVNGDNPVIMDEEKLTEQQKKMSHNEHMGHCFDYLRQALMCAGDTTLESAQRLPNGEWLPTVDGWGITHQCRSWEDAIEWTLEHHAPEDRSGILGAHSHHQR